MWKQGGLMQALCLCNLGRICMGCILEKLEIHIGYGCFKR